MSICMKHFYFPIKLLKSGFVANVKQRGEPSIGNCVYGCNLSGMRFIKCVQCYEINTKVKYMTL